MANDHSISALMFFTLGAVLLIALFALAWFLRQRRNRQIMGDVLDGKTTMDGGRSSAEDRTLRE